MPRVVIRNDREGDPLNVTWLSIMINSNKQMQNPHQFKTFKQEMRTLINQTLFEDPEVADEVFGKGPYVEEVTLHNISAEVGSKQYRGHVHLTVEIKHRVPKYSIAKLHSRMKGWLDAMTDRSWNVFIKLMPMRQANYNNKEDRWDANDEIPEGDPEVDRLSDERDLLELTTQRLGKLRILDDGGNLADNPRVAWLVQNKGPIADVTVVNE